MTSTFRSLCSAAALAVACNSAGPLDAQPQPDHRIIRLQQFLQERDCPVKALAPDFIEAADRHNLDWRLLPSISFVESTGGKFYRNNNIFGWANGNVRFPTVRHGIHLVANRLAEGRHYRNKTTDQLLATYNPRPAYRIRVKQVMQQIAPDEAVLDF
jgi:hypothetical protein